MAQGGFPGELPSFWDSGMYRLAEGSTAVFMDPVRVLNKSYTRYRLRPSSYYSRSPHPASRGAEVGGEAKEQVSAPSCSSRKRKRKEKKNKMAHDLNERERAAERRHQEARPFLLKAHESFLRATELLSALPALTRDRHSPEVGGEASEINFISLGGLRQASHFEISLCSPAQGTHFDPCCGKTVMPLFSNSVSNGTDDDLEAQFLNWYILPRESCFHMSDLRQIHDLVPDHSDYGYNLIVMDPPWENASACQKSLYPTLPSRYFLYIPVRQLAHTQGALVALWVTNREKLRMFVEEELFPSWGVTDFSVFYWLKVKTDGSMAGDLDLFHHRPYECLILGYVNGKGVDCGYDTTYSLPQNNQVIISIPGAYSRKPPVGKLLLDYVPGPKPANCIELFARELASGWTSWGNEPLHFQDSRYFADKSIEQDIDDGCTAC